jgi:hypothetical protein
MQAAPFIALGSQALGSYAEGRAAMGQARAEQQMARANAYVGETRAIQTGTAAAQDLAAQMAEMRAAFAANGQGTPGTGVFFQELRKARQRDARIAMANERLGAADWRMRGENAMAQGRGAYAASLFRAGKSLFEMGNLWNGPT